MIDTLKLSVHDYKYARMAYEHLMQAVKNDAEDRLPIEIYDAVSELKIYLENDNLVFDLPDTSL